MKRFFHSCFQAKKQVFFYCCLLSFGAAAQISSPGLGKAHTASWTALGLKQQLDSAGKIQSMTYLGHGRISKPDGFNPLEHQSIWVINQEFYFQLKKHWQISAALSYRRQNEYEDLFPYETASPSYKHELRAYGRLIYTVKHNRFKLALTLRQEYRKFLSPDLRPWEENLQLRTRFRAQLAYYAGKQKQHAFTLSGEPLFSLSHELSPHQTWTNFGYHESRLALYYSYTPPNHHFIYSIGYMNDLLGTPHHITDVHYLAMDLTWVNPFHHHHHHQHS